MTVVEVIIGVLGMVWLIAIAAGLARLGVSDLISWLLSGLLIFMLLSLTDIAYDANNSDGIALAVAWIVLSALGVIAFHRASTNLDDLEAATRRELMDRDNRIGALSREVDELKEQLEAESVTRGKWTDLEADIRLRDAEIRLLKEQLEIARGTSRWI